jgi:solute carrier family 25, member 39/40
MPFGSPDDWLVDDLSFSSSLRHEITGLTDFECVVTPFDVVKTRLQTQMPHKKSQATVQTCRHAPHISCTRSMSSYAASISPSPATSSSASKLLVGTGSKSLPEDLCLCLYEGNAMRTQRVTGFWDALIQVARFEGVRGLWKGVGTTL